MALGNDSGPYNDKAPWVTLFDPTSGQPVSPYGGGPAVTLASNVGIATGTQSTPVTGVAGSSYIWTVQATFGGATLTLQALGPDGVNYVDVATRTTNGSTGVVLGSNATVRIGATGGSATAVYSSLS